MRVVRRPHARWDTRMACDLCLLVALHVATFSRALGLDQPGSNSGDSIVTWDLTDANPGFTILKYQETSSHPMQHCSRVWRYCS